MHLTALRAAADAGALASKAMDQRQIEERVLRALETLYARDAALLLGNAAEWSVAHRLGVYLEHEFPSWNVDCEYNRQGTDRDGKKSVDGKGVRPDIVVHHRGFLDLEHNLLVIELKKDGSQLDESKVRGYTAPPAASKQFQYQFGLALTLSGKCKQLKWFAEGQELKCSN